MFHFYRPQTKLCFLMCLSVHTGGWGRVGEGGLSLCPGVSFQGGLCPGRSLSGGLCFLRCSSVHGGLGLCLGVSVRGSLSRGSLSREVSVQGVSIWGSLSKGGFCPGGLCQGDPRTVTSGRYASYWNAFLFKSSFLF